MSFDRKASFHIKRGFELVALRDLEKAHEQFYAGLITLQEQYYGALAMLPLEDVAKASDQRLSLMVGHVAARLIQLEMYDDAVEFLHFSADTQPSKELAQQIHAQAADLMDWGDKHDLYFAVSRRVVYCECEEGLVANPCVQLRRDIERSRRNKPKAPYRQNERLTQPGSLFGSPTI